MQTSAPCRSHTPVIVSIYCAFLPITGLHVGMQITINRPEKRNAFRPQTTEEMMRCFSDARDDPDVGVVILTGGF
jgi:hypothetical protein